MTFCKKGVRYQGKKEGRCKDNQTAGKASLPPMPFHTD